MDLYREENISLLTKIAIDSQKYGAISAAMTVEWCSAEITLQKAASIMKDTDRGIREIIYNKIQQRREVDKTTLDNLFTELIHLRHKVALNAGFLNYRDYKFDELGRFDYSIKDCYDFHQSIAKEILPLAEASDLERKFSLKLDALKPWDTEVDVEGRAPLRPFSDAADLVDKTIACFNKVRPVYEFHGLY